MARLAGKESEASLNFVGSRASSNRNLPQIPSFHGKRERSRLNFVLRTRRNHVKTFVRYENIKKYIYTHTHTKKKKVKKKIKGGEIRKRLEREDPLESLFTGGRAADEGVQICLTTPKATEKRADSKRRDYENFL